MRGLALALISAVALAACGQNANTPSGDAGGSASSVFPSLANASYRAEATITDNDGKASPLVMIRDARKMRMEITSDRGPVTVISNGETDEYLVITSGFAMRMTASGVNDMMANPAALWEREGTGATFTGPCTGAGQTGSQWSRNNDEGQPQTVCVTGDGIILKVTENGRTTWETTSVERGPQAATLFEAPPGVRVMDAGDMSGIMQQAMERAKQDN